MTPILFFAIAAQSSRTSPTDGTDTEAMRPIRVEPPRLVEPEAFDLPTWTEPSPRTDRRARRDPRGRLERRTFGGRGL